MDTFREAVEFIAASTLKAEFGACRTLATIAAANIPAAIAGSSHLEVDLMIAHLEEVLPEYDSGSGGRWIRPQCVPSIRTTAQKYL